MEPYYKKRIFHETSHLFLRSLIPVHFRFPLSRASTARAGCHNHNICGQCRECGAVYIPIDI